MAFIASAVAGLSGIAAGAGRTPGSTRMLTGRVWSAGAQRIRTGGPTGAGVIAGSAGVIAASGVAAGLGSVLLVAQAAVAHTARTIASGRRMVRWWARRPPAASELRRPDVRVRPSRRPRAGGSGPLARSPSERRRGGPGRRPDRAPPGPRLGG